MSLLDALKTKPEPKNKVAAILLKLEETERVALFEALGDRVWSHDGLARLLTEQGHPVSESSVRRYRRGLGL